MIYRLTGAAVRGVCVAIMLALPALMIPGAADENREVMALLALFAGGLVFLEYVSASPSLLEFRDAPPFNRTRFLALAVLLFLLSALMRAQGDSSTFHDLLHAVGFVIGDALDFPYSPVRLLVIALGDPADIDGIFLLRTAAGMAFLVSVFGLGLFLAALRLTDWPSGAGAFNVWINLPTFDPTTGGDIVERLQWDGRVNIGLGLLLPFLVPLVLSLGTSAFGPLGALTPIGKVWLVAGWGFLPLAFVMRGVAMARLANMIADKRRRASIEGPEARLFAL